MADRKLVLVSTFESPSPIEAVGPRAVEFIRASRDPETETYQMVREISRIREQLARQRFLKMKEWVLDPNRSDADREYATDVILNLQTEADFEDEMNKQGGPNGRQAA